MKPRKGSSERIRYQPAKRYPYDLEIFSVRDLKNRTSEEVMRRTFTYEFFMLIFITHGECVQFVDFNSVPCAQGDLLVLQPGQSHNFGSDNGWDGWIVLFRLELILAAPKPDHEINLVANPRLLPEKVTLCGNDLRRTTNLIAQMRADTRIDAPLEEVHALLRYQILLLLQFLSIFYGRKPVDERMSSLPLRRFKRFQGIVEERYAQWHQVADYSKKLGCTEKTLTRSTLLAVGLTAKAFIAARIILEAKRLLAHTELPIAAMAEALGFEEATHFTKFFKREAGYTPVEFRRRQIVVVSGGRSTG